MKNFRKNPASLRFMKTFLTAAERLAAAVHRDESDKSPFFVYSKEMSAVYPALEYSREKLAAFKREMEAAGYVYPG